MSSRIDEIFLFDIYVSILKIQNTSQKFSNAEDLKHDYMAWDSVIRDLEIIGEATNVLIKKEILSNELRAVVNLRNILIHHYFGIDAEEIWNIIDSELLDLKELIESKILELEVSERTFLIEEISQEFYYLDFVVQQFDKLKSV
ncbi:MAG: DUF86 domain-containing protein [Epsilonproteobacteria bacterium]|nr:DUF86 domain-containing protein [Campylobacterota bacterium]